MLFSHGLFIIESATGCSNGEPSELKKEIYLSSRQILRFFCRRTCFMYIYLYIDVAMIILALVELLKITLIIVEKCKRH